MDYPSDINRRKFLVRGAGVAGAASALTSASLAQPKDAPAPPVIDRDAPLAHYWQRPVYQLAEVDLETAARELASEPIKERHRIYCLLLMKLILRFWNGNKHGPIGIYPQREGQKEDTQDPRSTSFRYRGDMFKGADPLRVSWDRYLGHNIACLAVDGKGEIIDFDFNHNDFFRSSAEHAESRMVRRLFSLTNIFDNWRTGEPVPGKSRAFSLTDVTLYTSLESCAQCAGVMSLGRVKQVVFLQRDFTAYAIGNIMYNLAGRDEDNLPLAPLPIPASAVDLPYFNELNAEYTTFHNGLLEAQMRNDKLAAFFIPSGVGSVEYSPSITSFLCTDSALSIFRRGSGEFDDLGVGDENSKNANDGHVWTNQKCLSEAQRFFQYADVEGYRGSPHKL
jgi:tRNA(Arg) A34 adenosine deaminase TadA